MVKKRQKLVNIVCECPLIGNLAYIPHIRDHPFKMLSVFRGGGVKNMPNLPMDSSIKILTEGGRGKKL